MSSWFISESEITSSVAGGCSGIIMGSVVVELSLFISGSGIVSSVAGGCSGVVYISPEVFSQDPRIFLHSPFSSQTQ